MYTTFNLDIGLEMGNFNRSLEISGDLKAIGNQIGKLMDENRDLAKIIAVALIKYHTIGNEFTEHEAKVRTEIALDEPEEVLAGCV